MTKVLVGTFAGSLSHVTLAPEVLKAAEAELAKAAAEKASIRPTVVVDAEFFHRVVHELDRALEVERRWYARRRDLDRRDGVAGKIRYLHEGYAATLARVAS
jgi:hypothetical protein